MIFLCVNEFECVSADKEIEANYRDLLHDVMLSMSTRDGIHYVHHYHRLHYNYITNNNDKNNTINNYKILRTSIITKNKKGHLLPKEWPSLSLKNTDSKDKMKV